MGPKETPETKTNPGENEQKPEKTLDIVDDLLRPVLIRLHSQPSAAKALKEAHIHPPMNGIHPPMNGRCLGNATQRNAMQCEMLTSRQDRTGQDRTGRTGQDAYESTAVLSAVQPIAEYSKTELDSQNVRAHHPLEVGNHRPRHGVSSVLRGRERPSASH